MGGAFPLNRKVECPHLCHANLWGMLPEHSCIQVRALLEIQLKLLEEYPDLFIRSKSEKFAYDNWRHHMEELKRHEKQRYVQERKK